MLTLLAAAAFAGAPYPLTLIGGYGGGLGPATEADGLSAGGFVEGHAVFWAKKAPVGIELSNKEGIFAGDTRVLGGLELCARIAPKSGPWFIDAGFAHNHETPYETALENPIYAMIGSASGIRHRTGFVAGFGVDAMIPERTLGDRLGVQVALTVAAFPDRSGPPVYVMLEQGFTFDIGKPRAQ